MRPALPLLALALTLSSCGNLQNLATRSRAKKQQRAMDQLAATSSQEASSRLGARSLGEVAYVDDAEQFVLIRTLNGIAIPPLASLESQRHGKTTALLRSTPERKNTFAAADILEGNPQSGDAVLPSTAKPSPRKKPRTSPSPTPPPAPATPPSAPADPAHPDEARPMAPPDDDLDPTRLPALQDPIKSPNDLKR